MAQYTGIQGSNILIVSSDPANPVEGQIWYNSTSNTLKGYTYGVASWATGGNMSQPQGINSGAGIQTAALTFCGFNATTGSGGSAITQSYNGTSWSPAPNLNNAAYSANGCGTQGAAFKNGGYSASLGYQNKTEHFNGSSWSNQTNSPRVVDSGTSTGSQTAALVSGGSSNSSCLLWTSSSWTTGPSFVNPASGWQGAGSAGSQTTALVFGGFGTPTSTGTGTQTFNGSAFSSAPNLNNAAYRSGAGTQNAAIAFGQAGPGGDTNYTELYNGSSWTSTTGFSVPRGDANQNSANSAPSSTALIFGGRPPGPGGTNSTEEFTGAAAATRTVTVS